MIYLIISDIHSNLEALEAIFDAASGYRYETVLLLGDVVGYGPNPDEVINFIKHIPQKVISVRGNHDYLALSDVRIFPLLSEAAESGIMWTRDNMSISSREFLREMPKGPILLRNSFQICHGSPHNEDSYIFSEYDFIRTVNQIQIWLTFTGHTHTPLFGSKTTEGEYTCKTKSHPEDISIKLNKTNKYIINFGAAGQPRDGNPKAAFGMFDSEENSVTFKRIPYNIKLTQSKILKAGIHPLAAKRLEFGA